MSQSLKKLDEAYLRDPEEVHEIKKPKPMHFRFPSPEDIEGALRVTATQPLIRLTAAAVGYGDTSSAILSNLTLEVSARACMYV